jgi:DNA-binding MarR family transcriptional regulator
MAQVELLQRLAEEPGLRVSDLAARHRLATNTVSGLVQQMVEAGLVDRRVDPTDRRATTVELTPLGRERLRGWMRANSRRLESALSDLSAADQRAIASALPALTRLVHRLEATDRTHPEAPGT